MTRGSTPQQSPPEDGKELERSSGKRYATQSGQSSIHGRALWEIQSQESQTMGFYASNGQGGAGNGASTGKHVLFTPGSSLEHLGQNIKAKGISDGDYNPAKVIICEHGDIHFEAKDGDIFLKGKNIHIFADGGGEKGNIDIKANKNLNLTVNAHNSDTLKTRFHFKSFSITKKESAYSYFNFLFEEEILKFRENQIVHYGKDYFTK